MEQTAWKVLNELYRDADQTMEQIASECRIDGSEATEIRRQLEDRQVIQGETPVIKPGALGFSVPSYHFIKTAENYDEVLEDGVGPFDMWNGSQLASVVLGEHDLVLRKVSENGERFNNFANNLIDSRDFPTIRDSSSYRVTERIRWHGQNVPGDQIYGVDPVDLSPVDRDVLIELQRDGALRDKPEQIAQSLDLSAGTVVDAVQRLEENVILGYSINTDLEAGGLHRAYLTLKTVRGGYDETVEALREEPPLSASYVVSGTGHEWSDLGVEIVFDSIDHLDRQTDRIRTVSGARETRTFASTKTLYDSGTYDLN